MLDHAATSPVDPRVAEVVRRALVELPGNPMSAHSAGREARRSLEASRGTIAASLGASAEEIVFTSGGTESDNLAVIGAARAGSERGRHVLTTAVEHVAVLRSVDRLEKEGFETTRLPVDGEGLPERPEVGRELRRGLLLALGLRRSLLNPRALLTFI